MRDREDRIVEAYEDTFTWIFKSQDTSWISFAEWLKNSQGDSQLYWITGKPASGKSTLMKFIGTRPQTRELLAQWAGSLPLLTASFYFWNSGAEIQMSQAGVLRSLLFQILNEYPNLLPIVLAERWEVASLFRFNQSPFTVEELRVAFKRLAQNVQHYKICFFIDGLDEFDGDHMELVRLIAGITTCSNIKICVASRPWTVFEDAFRAKPSLLLQDLTKRDIDHFVTSNFRKDSNFEEFEKHEPEAAQQILGAIVEKAAGVFLWVHLVTTSLLSGLKNGDRVADLNKRLELLPDDLESLYEKILQSLDPFYLEHALQYFDLMKSARQPLTLLDLSFADEDPGFVPECKVKPISADERRYRAETMRRRLNSRCKGLLEVARDRCPAAELNVLSRTSGLLTEIIDASEATSTVQYLHQTVKDYLENERRWASLLDKRSWTYDPHMALLRSFVAQFKVECPEFLDRDRFSKHVEHILYQARRCEFCSAESSLSVDYIPLLQTFDLTAQKLSDESLGRINGPPRIKGDHWTKTQNIVAHLKPPGTHESLDTSLLSLAVRLNLQYFVKSRIQRGCLEKRGHIMCPLLYDAVIEGIYVPSSSHFQRPSLDMVKLLLSNMADPNYKIGNLTVWQKLVSDLALMNDGDLLVFIQQPWEEISYEFLRHGAAGTIGIPPVPVYTTTKTWQGSFISVAIKWSRLTKKHKIQFRCLPRL